MKTCNISTAAKRMGYYQFVIKNKIKSGELDSVDNKRIIINDKYKNEVKRHKELTAGWKAAEKSNKVWHLFARWCEKNFGKKWEENLHGYKAMTKVETYVKTHPEIKIMKCDDNVHATSLLVLIPHKGFGNTVIPITQCSDSKNIFFLYPKNQTELVKLLSKMEYKDND